DLAAQVARYQRRRLFEEQIVEVVADLAAHLEAVTEALGGDQPHLGALALDHGVGDERGAVYDGLDLANGNVRLAQQSIDALADGEARIAGRGQPLADEDHVAGFVDQHEVGEGTTDVDADPRAHGFGAGARLSRGWNVTWALGHVVAPYTGTGGASHVHAVVSFRRGHRHVAVPDVAPDRFTIALFGIAVATAARVPHDQPIAGLDGGAGLGMRLSAVREVDRDRGARLTAGEALRGMLLPVGDERQPHYRG